jgi:redox-sensitive bicupin YhaK (pirin superfamily)
MKHRTIAFAFAPSVADEAKGVIRRRSIGGERLALLDPFLLLDHVTVDPAHDGGEIGFPRHPHRGIETLSYVIDGEVSHRDSLGNEGRVGAGGTQWMTAGNGIYHEEMLSPGADGGEFLQLWFNLPRSQKRIPAAYAGVPGANVPTVAGDGYSVRVVAGEFAGVTGAFVGIAVGPTVLDLTIEPGHSVTIPTTEGEAALSYLIRGSIPDAPKDDAGPQLLVFTDGSELTLTAGADGARLLFAAARLLNEPVLQYRSLVMSTPEDIQETYEMMASGHFAQPATP